MVTWAGKRKRESKATATESRHAAADHPPGAAAVGAPGLLRWPLTLDAAISYLLTTLSDQQAWDMNTLESPDLPLDGALLQELGNRLWNLGVRRETAAKLATWGKPPRNE